VTLTVSAPPCDECPARLCQFSRSRVYFYLTVARQAHILREPFDVVLRSLTTSSRLIDPWLRGGGRGDFGQMIGLALADVGARYGIDITNPHNADAISKLLCPDRWDESVDDDRESS